MQDRFSPPGAGESAEESGIHERDPEERKDQGGGQYLARLTQHLPQDDLWFGLALIFHVARLPVFKPEVDGVDSHL